uniref:Uncharacterized protein TCIL3000_4_3000 n=1 Tax=Trypanosoma congolense (strain IL3000) TaxID=1068625 RepID=G0ULF2_TRYCI|nr:unnamed protein product [Trypanosoma congolense IL3000]
MRCLLTLTTRNPCFCRGAVLCYHCVLQYYCGFEIGHITIWKDVFVPVQGMCAFVYLFQRYLPYFCVRVFFLRNRHRSRTVSQMQNVAPEVAAQASARREASADLGPWKEVVLALAKELPAGSGARPVRDALRYLQEEKAETLQNLERLREGSSNACHLNDTDALQWKNQGNEAYASKKLDECVLMYTRGMMYADTDGCLAALVNNRSTVFMAQNRLLGALADAHVAYTLLPTYWKALQRRGVCLQRLGYEQEGLRDVEAATGEDAARANAEGFIAKVLLERAGKGGCCEARGSDSAGPSCAASDSISDLVSHGPGVVGVMAKGLVGCGDVIREKPAAYALYDDHWGVRCLFCLKATLNLYPGTAYRSKGKAARGLFCSEQCASASWERDGQFESTNSFFYQCPIDSLIACRLLRSEQMQGVKQLKLRGNFSGELYPAAVVGGYETAVSILALIFGAVSGDDVDRLRLTQRQVALCAFEVGFHTGTQITINTETREALIDDSRPISVCKAVYLTAARLRHSCRPNCFASFVGNPLDCTLQLCVRAIRPIAADEELTIAYHNMTTYKAVSAQTRRRALAERCGFLCSCVACTTEVKEEPVGAEKKAYYIQAGELYQKGCRMIREGKFDVAVTVLSQSYAITMEHICPPPRPPQSMLPKVHLALAKAFNRLKDNEKCVKHLLRKVELD